MDGSVQQNTWIYLAELTGLVHARQIIDLVRVRVHTSILGHGLENERTRCTES